MDLIENGIKDFGDVCRGLRSEAAVPLASHFACSVFHKSPYLHPSPSAIVAFQMPRSPACDFPIYPCF